ncbi:D-alanyl-D-alanine carboxypeptidase [Ignatzschineria rhizosphaerae]|uniref:D-alanyl-D-alanine carboxypeptidase n=1 Tax=Ignatzschineria rhizosphaerae TaxID=2923279 RepID=A0ABY3X0W3_9GAMM|nr:D-alanyl-D-alanine carboxypeptidase family protein [Ignatzschineria rhizosphaerae]UNM96491.1 D-alanyl-D-alanine carboxypeptidase [Ignatzschineria rhizosphaerae]
MFKKLFTICAVAVTSMSLSVAQSPNSTLQLPEYAVKSWIIMDYETGAILAESNSRLQLEPASITKVMTDYVAADALQKGTIHANDKVLVSAKSRSMSGSRMFLEEGTLVSVNDLLQGLIVQSGNDAAVAIAEHIAFSEESFAVKMNETAAELGMKDSHFKNASGLPDPEHVTTAFDLAVLSRALIKNFPEHYKFYSQKSFTWNNIKQNNRNTLLWEDSSVDGIKTGHTDSAGYNLASSAERNGFRIIVVVMGANNEAYRQRVSRELINFAFQNFDRKKIYEANEVIARANVLHGIDKTVPVGVSDSITATLPRVQYDNLKAQIKVNSGLEAPVMKGEQVGNLEFYIDNHLLHSFPVVALKDVEKTGIFQRLWESFLGKLNNKINKFKEAL